jgi:hypothetical protein
VQGGRVREGIAGGVDENTEKTTHLGEIDE